MKPIAAAILIVFAMVSVSAHEYWFEADSFVLKPKQSTDLHLFVGEALKMDEERTFQPEKTRSFDLFSPDGKFDMRSLADANNAPLLRFSADKDGTYMFVMERDWSYITLEAAKFEDYLRDEGMDYIVTERKRLGESAKPGRERYSRFLKSLVQVGNNGTGNIKTRIGSKLEIVPLDNPYSKKAGGVVTFQFWFDGRPLSDYTVFADNRLNGKVTTTKLTTDKEGKADVKLDRKGVWLVRLVYMQRCPRNCGESDWESFWGALSFGVR